MRLLLSEQWKNHLCALPESGMGFQRVDILLRDGEQVRDVLVFNAQQVEWPKGKRAISSDDIAEIKVRRRRGAGSRPASRRSRRSR